MAEVVRALAPLVEKSGGSLVIEAGHFYAEIGVDETVLAGVAVAASLAGLIADRFSIQPDKMLLVDDIGTTFEPSTLLAAFSGYQLVLESGLITAGNQTLAGLAEQGLTKDHKGRQYLKRGWVPLQGKAGISHYPACEVLDTVLYQQKLAQWGGAITVLPHGYQDQQRKTKVIYQAVTGNNQPNVLVVYHSRQAEIIEADYWG